MHSSPKSIQSFEALRVPQYRLMVIGYLLTMMADNVEHVVSYWVMYQQFHSAMLGGFAVVSHWVPFLIFSLPAGALADRYDPRRLIQIGMLMFMGCSAAWAYLFLTDTLTLPAAMTILVIHGLSGVFWNTASQIILYDLVSREVLPSGIRTLATARYVGLIVGPGVGAGLMLLFGPKWSLVVNCLLYLPNFLWLINAPCGPKFRAPGEAPAARPFQGLADVTATVLAVAKNRPVLMMTLLAGAASFFVSNSYQAQMPAYAEDLGHGDPGLTYSLLLAADAVGALCAGLLWEYLGQRNKPSVQQALLFSFLWAGALLVFAVSQNYALSLLVLFVAGFAELSSNAMAQTIVQLNAPLEIRGRVIGLFNVSALGLRFGSGIFVGLVGGVVGNHTSLAIACLFFLAFAVYLRMRFVRMAG